MSATVLAFQARTDHPDGLTAAQLNEITAVIAAWPSGWTVEVHWDQAGLAKAGVSEAQAFIHQARWGDRPMLVIARTSGHFYADVVEALEGRPDDRNTIGDFKTASAALRCAGRWALAWDAH